MYAPTTLTAAVLLMLLTMLCWGSWANAFSLCRGRHRFELFYWDYALGVLVGTLALSAMLGPQSAVFHGGMDSKNVAWALLAGTVFNLGNVLLVAAISLTGMAVAFPVCIGLALLIGVGLSWCIEPSVPAVPMAIGSLLILASMIMDAAAYHAMASEANFSKRGLVIAIVGGIFMGAFPPCLQKAMVGEHPLDPYAASVLLAAGVFVCTVLTNGFFMRWPIAGGKSARFEEYFKTSTHFHLLGIAGGIIWAAGGVFNFIAADQVGVAVGYAFGTGGTLVAAIWGVFVWKEFREAPRRAYYWLFAMFFFFIAGIGVIADAKARMADRAESFAGTKENHVTLLNR